MKKIFIVLGLFLLIQPIFSQKCTTIITPIGKLSVKKSLTLYWDNMVKDSLSERGRIIYTLYNSTDKKTEDTIKGIFIVNHISKHFKAYHKTDNKIHKITVYKICVFDTISKRSFIILSQKEFNFKGKKIKKGDSIYLTIIPLTEYDYSKTIYGSSLFCLSYNNIYVYKYSGPLGIAISPNLQGTYYFKY